MSMAQLGDVVEFLDSHRQPIKAANRIPGPYPYYGANGQQGTINGYIFNEPLILLAEDGGHFFEPNRGIAYKISGKTWVNNHAHVLRVKSGTDIDYLCLVLKNLDVTQHLTGSTRPKLTKSGANRIQIPLPPLPEQKRIAAILDAADELRAKRHESIKLLDDLIQSTFLEMFGDPVTNPEGWETKMLFELGNIKTGSTPPSKLDGMFDGKIPFITPSDLMDTWIKPSRTVTEIGAIHSRTVERGATLICCIGATIGKMGKTSTLSAFNQQINSISWYDEVVDDFGLEMMKFYKSKIARDGASTTLPILKKSRFEKISVPVPPFKLQQHFATIIKIIENQKARLQAHLKELDTLFASLQQRAFNGEL